MLDVLVIKILLFIYFLCTFNTDLHKNVKFPPSLPPTGLHLIHIIFPSLKDIRLHHQISPACKNGRATSLDTVCL